MNCDRCGYEMAFWCSHCGYGSPAELEQRQRAEKAEAERDALRAELAEIKRDYETHGHHSGCRHNERQLRTQIDALKAQLVECLADLVILANAEAGNLKTAAGRAKAIELARKIVEETRALAKEPKT